MEKDIIERLYDISERPDCEYSTELYDAVSEIERLRAALREIADIKSYSEVSKAIKVAAIARAALAEEKPND